MRTPQRPGDGWIEENIVKPHYAAAEDFTRTLGYGCHAALADRLGLSAWDAGYLIVALQMRGVLMQELDAEGHWKMWQTPEFLKPENHKPVPLERDPTKQYRGECWPYW
jgi:hypothetical protein